MMRSDPRQVMPYVAPWASALGAPAPPGEGEPAGERGRSPYLSSIFVKWRDKGGSPLCPAIFCPAQDEAPPERGLAGNSYVPCR